jgi:ferric-dicitrate binding protein FerR (iron transport regulator)
MTRIRSLFEKYYHQTATAEEKAELAHLVAGAADEELRELITSTGEQLTETDNVIPARRAEEILAGIIGAPAKPQRRIGRGWFRYAAAAVLLLAVAGGIYFWQQPPAPPSLSAHANDVAPGQTGAVLTLGNGRSVELDSAGSGIVARQSGASAVLRQGGLSYDTTGAAGYSMNTLMTPRGRQFTLTLPDGSKVWLNAASSLTYPTRFTGTERKVTLTGEAYFEVAKNAARPFIVAVNDLEVQVLGTGFNVNGYEDEAETITTLVEGAVLVSRGGEKMKLQPGEQSAAGKAAMRLQRDANIDEITAWKDGNFYFDNSTLPVILRQFARWYNVEVVYEGPVQDRQFFGMISRRESLASVLKLLQAGDIKFRIEGNKLFVQPD